MAIIENVKQCSDCQEIKTLDNFHKRLASNDGLSYRCKDCAAKRAKKRNYKKLYKEYNREYLINRKYGLTETEYDDMMKECNICHSKEKLVLDHNHKTGKIRGCLCHKCNTGLGLFEDNSFRLHLAAAYLNKYEDEDKNA